MTQTTHDYVVKRKSHRKKTDMNRRLITYSIGKKKSLKMHNRNHSIANDISISTGTCDDVKSTELYTRPWNKT